MTAPQLRAHTVYTLEDRVRILRRLVWAPEGGLRDPLMRRLGLAVTNGVKARDDMGELGAIFDFVVRNVRYTGDIAGKDTFQTGLRTLQFGGGDCFPLATTKVICRSRSTRQYELVRLADLRLAWPMYEALSYNFGQMRYEFKAIQAFQDKGEREVLKARLSNGTDLVATADHGFWALDGQKPQHFKQNLERRTLGEYLEQYEKRPKWQQYQQTRILQAARIPALDEVDCPEDLAYLSGIYAAEGYDDGKHVCISQSKPEIRAKIERSLNTLGVPFRFQPPRPSTVTDKNVGGGAYYAMKSHEVKDALRAQGSNSFNMQLAMPLLSGSRSTVEAVMRGYEDGDAYHPKPESRWFKKVSAIYATSSDALAEQLRFGFLLLGQPFNSHLQHNHMGVGKHPIWRLHAWNGPNVQRRQETLADVLPGLRYGQVRKPEPAGREHVGCITVEDNHNFFLADGTLASNCDDHSVLACTLAMENGFESKFRITSNRGTSWDHIFAMCGVPKHRPTNWVALDTTLGPGRFGRQPPMAKYRDFAVGTG